VPVRVAPEWPVGPASETVSGSDVIEDRGAGGERGGPEGERVLRAKYLDWCSARLADRFMRLTPEGIYALAERAESERAVPGNASGGLTFASLVERVTARLAAELSLPRYEEWSYAYGEDPSRFEEELSGLWREGV